MWLGRSVALSKLEGNSIEEKRGEMMLQELKGL